MTILSASGTVVVWNTMLAIRIIDFIDDPLEKHEETAVIGWMSLDVIDDKLSESVHKLDDIVTDSLRLRQSGLSAQNSIEEEFKHTSVVIDSHVFRDNLVIIVDDTFAGLIIPFNLGEVVGVHPPLHSYVYALFGKIWIIFANFSAHACMLQRFHLGGLQNRSIFL